MAMVNWLGDSDRNDFNGGWMIDARSGALVHVSVQPIVHMQA